MSAWGSATPDSGRGGGEGLTGRFNRKAMEAAQRILGEARVVDYGAGFAGLHPMYLAAAFLAIFLGLLALTGVMLGAIPIVVIGQALRKPRGVVLTDRGVTLCSVSFFGARPSGVLASFPADVLVSGAGPANAWYIPVRIGGERIWLRAKDHRRILSHLSARH